MNGKYAAVLSASLLGALSTIPNASAEEYRQVTLVTDTILCFARGDWDKIVAASIDEDADQAQRLLDDGKCRMLDKPMRVSYLDPASGGNALVQLPSGKTAYTSQNFIKK